VQSPSEAITVDYRCTALAITLGPLEQGVSFRFDHAVMAPVIASEIRKHEIG